MNEMASVMIDKAFSAGVAAFLLVRMEAELRRLRGAIEALRRCEVCALEEPEPGEEVAP